MVNLSKNCALDFSSFCHGMLLNRNGGRKVRSSLLISDLQIRRIITNTQGKSIYHCVFRLCHYFCHKFICCIFMLWLTIPFYPQNLGRCYATANCGPETANSRTVEPRNINATTRPATLESRNNH